MGANEGRGTELGPEGSDSAAGHWAGLCELVDRSASSTVGRMLGVLVCVVANGGAEVGENAERCPAAVRAKWNSRGNGGLQISVMAGHVALGLLMQLLEVAVCVRRCE